MSKTMSLSFCLTALTVKIPEDILLEILFRLPAYSLMRFKCVSKLWSSLISSRYFTNLFLEYSSSTKRERRVFVYTILYKLLSSSLSNLDATDFLQLSPDLTFPCIKKDRLKFVNALRGLMCFRVEIERDSEEGHTQICIINFTTRQVLSLPLVESNMESDVHYRWNYFGYDPIDDEYKVLNIITTIDDETYEWRSETQVLVLGDRASWRNTKSLTFFPASHVPEGGLSINGVLYYGACCHQGVWELMIFYFNSEEFNLIEFPVELLIKWNSHDEVNLMNYQNQVAAFADSRLYSTECILDLWVLEDARKSKWSSKVFVLPCHQIRVSLELEDSDDIYIKGTSRSGELTLRGGRQVNRNNKSAHAFYDLKENRITRVVVFEPPHPNYAYVGMNIWEDVESIMYLEA